MSSTWEEKLNRHDRPSHYYKTELKQVFKIPMDERAAVSRLAHPTTWATSAGTLPERSVTWRTHPVRHKFKSLFLSLLLRRMRPIITIVFTPSPGRQARRHSAQRASMLAVNKVPLLLATWRSRHTNFNLVGVEFGRHDAAVELSSALLVRVSDEPGAGTTDYCCTFTAKGAKERPRKRARMAL